MGRGKDRDEPSFKRSESFKRISIRKSYLDRGKRRQKLQKNAAEAREKTQANSAPAPAPAPVPAPALQLSNKEDIGVIGYGEWLNGVLPTSESPVDLVNGFEVLKLDKSPVLGRREARSTAVISDTDLTESQEQSTSPSVSISLGRVWRDSIPVSSLVPGAPCAHHSLDSGLKERVVKPLPTVARTVSAPEKCPVTIREESAQGFGFSLSISRLAAFRRSRNGFFRKKKPKPKPSLSVSPDGYFKRTVVQRKSGSFKNKGRSRFEANRSKPEERELEERSLSPVWFVPPERRRSRRQRRVWREIRYLTAELDIDDTASEHSDQFDDQKLLLSGDFNERHVVNSSRIRTTSSASSSPSSGQYSAVGKISDFNEDKLVSEELRVSGVLAKRRSWQPDVSNNYFASRYFNEFLNKGSTNSRTPPKDRDERYRRQRSATNTSSYRCYSSESDSEPSPCLASDKKGDKQPVQEQHQIQQQFNNGQRRRPLRRRSQLRRGGQPVYLVRKCSSLRRRTREFDKNK